MLLAGGIRSRRTRSGDLGGPGAGRGPGGDRPGADRARAVPRAGRSTAHWTLVAANRVVPALLTGVAPELLQPPINVLRLSLHPDGVAPQIANYLEWRAHLLARLSHQVELTADRRPSDLLRELAWLCQGIEARGTPINPFRTKPGHRWRSCRSVSTPSAARFR